MELRKSGFLAGVLNAFFTSPIQTHEWARIVVSVHSCEFVCIRGQDPIISFGCPSTLLRAVSLSTRQRNRARCFVVEIRLHQSRGELKRSEPGSLFGKNPLTAAVPVRTLAPPRTAGWSSLVARQAHNLKVVGSNPAPATILRLGFVD